MGAKEDAWQRGTYKCSDCKYYGKSTLTPCMRCRHPDNIRDGRWGHVYILNPAARNWHNKCEYYELKETP
jgi:hypothetical protein